MFASLRFEEFRPHHLMMGGWVMLGDVVCPVFPSWGPEHRKVSLFHAISNPVESHIDRFLSFVFDVFVSESDGRGVVNLNWRRRLFVAKLS